jgi:trehalose/maltose hydrolase-like predicted phosphorylase
VIPPGLFAVEPWSLTESPVRLDFLGQTESIFALSNGHIGLRGNLDEGEPHATPGTYLNGFSNICRCPTRSADMQTPTRVSR